MAAAKFAAAHKHQQHKDEKGRLVAQVDAAKTAADAERAAAKQVSLFKSLQHCRAIRLDESGFFIHTIQAKIVADAAHAEARKAGAVAAAAKPRRLEPAEESDVAKARAAEDVAKAKAIAADGKRRRNTRSTPRKPPARRRGGGEEGDGRAARAGARQGRRVKG